MGMLWLSLLTRDLLQVVFSGTALVPDLTVLALVWISVTRCEDVSPLFIQAFAVGLLWDLRWTALPGMTSCVYVLLVSATGWTWMSLSPRRRSSPLMFFSWALLAHGLTAFLPGLFSGQALGAASPLVAQQVAAMPFILGLTALFILREKTHHD